MHMDNNSGTHTVHRVFIPNCSKMHTKNPLRVQGSGNGTQKMAEPGRACEIYEHKHKHNFITVTQVSTKSSKSKERHLHIIYKTHKRQYY